MLRNILIIFLLQLTLSGCDVVNTLKDGIEQSDLAAVAIESKLGVKPVVGFNYNNTELTAVTVQFMAEPNKPLAEVEKVSRAAVKTAFKKEPQSLVISFVYPKSS